MNLTRQPTSVNPAVPAGRRGSVLVVVLWIVFGLVSITLYFANSMNYELRASDNRVAGEEADFAIDAARRYITCVLSNLNEPGVMPDLSAYQFQGVPVGNAKYYIIGRTNVENQNVSNVVFGLACEGAKLNLNALPSISGYGMADIASNLALLPHMTLDVAWNIIAWGNTNTQNSVGAAESQTYLMQTPPYLCKNAPYESVDELRLVFGMNIDLLYGEDANLNGALDANENDGDALPPTDNQDGRLDPGLLEFFTVDSVEPANDTNGNARINITSETLTNPSTNLQALLSTNFGTTRAAQILATAGFTLNTGGGGGGGGGGGNNGGGNGGGATTAAFTSPLDFFIKSQMSPAEIAVVEPSLRGPNLKGLVNINLAPSQVIQCLPGMTQALAQQLVTARQNALTDPYLMNSIGWLTQAIDPQIATQLGPWVTARTYQYVADIAAVGHDGRGYRRVRFVFDTSQGIPVILRRQDLTSLGWALGRTVRNDLLAHK